MFISDTKPNRERYQKTIGIYLCVTLFTALFGGVYEVFGHGVFSFPMLYAFAFPLAGGVAPFFLLMTHRKAYPSSLSTGAYHAGIATLTVGSLVSGALEIYGTESPLLIVYQIVGAALVLIGILTYLILGGILRSAKQKRSSEA